MRPDARRVFFFRLEVPLDFSISDLVGFPSFRLKVAQVRWLSDFSLPACQRGASFLLACFYPHYLSLLLLLIFWGGGGGGGD